MSPRLIAALSLSALAFIATPALAGTDSQYAGGCRFDGELYTASTATWTGTLISTTVVSAGTPSDNPVSATVTCFIMVNGVTKAEAPFSGTVAVAGAQQVRFTAVNTDIWNLCETVDYTSDDTPSTTLCYDSIGPPLIPQPIVDLIDAVCQVSCHGPLFDGSLVCPLLAQLDPVDLPGVDVNAQGDVFLQDSKVYDCPPYDWTTS